VFFHKHIWSPCLSLRKAKDWRDKKMSTSPRDLWLNTAIGNQQPHFNYVEQHLSTGGEVPLFAPLFFKTVHRECSHLGGERRGEHSP
jgi:hypothetical protein